MAGRTPATPPSKEARAAGGCRHHLRADLDGQTAGDLGHGSEEGERAAVLHRLVGDGGDAGVEQGAGQLRLGAQVEVREQDEPFAEAVVLRRDRFLHLHDHVRAGPDVVGLVHEFGSRRLVLCIGDAGSGPGTALDQDGVSVGAELMDAGRGDRHPELVVLHFFGDADDHGILQVAIGADGVTPR